MTGCRIFVQSCLLLVLATTATAATGVQDPRGASATPDAATPMGSMAPADAAGFLSQATLGADWDEIHRMAGLGQEAWLEEQFNRPVGYHQPYLDQLAVQFTQADPTLELEVEAEHRRWSWWQQVMQGPDPLRQRIALALSEHFVVSDDMDRIRDTPQGLVGEHVHQDAVAARVPADERRLHRLRGDVVRPEDARADDDDEEEHERERELVVDPDRRQPAPDPLGEEDGAAPSRGPGQVGTQAMTIAEHGASSSTGGSIG